MFRGVGRIRVFEAREIEQHEGDDAVGPRPRNGRAHPQAFGASAGAHGDDLALEFVVLRDEQGSLNEPDFLIGKEADGGPSHVKAVVARGILEQHAEHASMTAMFAVEYKVYTDESDATILVSTLVSVATLGVCIALTSGLK